MVKIFAFTRIQNLFLRVCIYVFKAMLAACNFHVGNFLNHELFLFNHLNDNKYNI